VLPLGFRFDFDAVIIDGTAHKGDCPIIQRPLPAGTVRLAAGEVYRSQHCPRECECAPPFETLLSYLLERSALTA
jgi:hypothetical protein